VYGPGVLEALIRRVGADRIILGTDYPFGEDDPVGAIRKVTGVSRMDVDKIVSQTPAAILGLAI
jgi:aminocarboxymuconate-semialdehyde decarboxylase